MERAAFSSVSHMDLRDHILDKRCGISCTFVMKKNLIINQLSYAFFDVPGTQPSLLELYQRQQQCLGRRKVLCNHSLTFVARLIIVNRAQQSHLALLCFSRIHNPAAVGNNAKNVLTIGENRLFLL